jgi:hypothetical protein
MDQWRTLVGVRYIDMGGAYAVMFTVLDVPGNSS